MKQTAGRSMIEMIGVLAIIGVLSTVGIWGLNKALTKSRVNNLIEDVRLAGFIVIDEILPSMTQIDSTEQNVTSLAGKFDAKTDYPFTAFKESDVTFAIVAGKVSEVVCKETITRKVEWLEEIRPNGLDNECKEGNENTISFFFNTKLNTQMEDFFGSCEEDADCGECGTCNGRRCVYEVGPVKASNGQCKSCTEKSDYIPISNMEECDKCSNRFSGWYGERCYLCNKTAFTSYTSKANCLKCPSRYWIGTNENNGNCYYCPEGGIMNAERSSCNVYCPDNNTMFDISAGQCTSCTISTNIIYVLNKAECDRCSNRFLGYGADRCYLCNGTAAVSNTSKANCLKCPSRYWVGTNEDSGNCYYCPEGGIMNAERNSCDVSCTDDNTMFDISAGQCKSCTVSSNIIYVLNKAECDKCSNRFLGYGTDRCYLCNGTAAVSNTSKANCLKCPNRYWTGADENRGTCYYCSGTVTEDGMGCIP